VIEVKSTFLRRSEKDAWLHGTTTLRKAGLQLRRKLVAIEAALRSDTALSGALGLDAQVPQPAARGWIIDTSIEQDHERFSGFLKVSVEEVLIALRDDRHLLDDPLGLASGRGTETQESDLAPVREKRTLYPDGFTAPRFVEVVEGEAVWQQGSAIGERQLG
jgi:hypothetical protein